MTSTAPTEPFVYTPASVAWAAGPGRSADQVDATRREIAELVRDVAVAARSDRTPAEFFGLLVDRMARAMAAEGVVVWELSGVPPADPCDVNQVTFEARQRLGRITDQSLPPASIGAHRRLLAEVVNTGQPVVVPPTPGATDPETPANPTTVPVAVVPIEWEPAPARSTLLLEVFLEPASGVATQRGYLRFVAQMADLAAEFLRGDQLRRLRQVQQLSSRIDQAVMALHDIHQQSQLRGAIVDQIAELFHFDRVGLCLGDPPRLMAVSHVETLDRQSAAGRRLAAAAGAGADSRWDDHPEADEEGLVVRAVIIPELDSSFRVICLQTADAVPIDGRDRVLLERYVNHAAAAIGHVRRLESIPAGRLLASLSGRAAGGTSPRRRLIVSGLLVAITAAAMLFPVPLVVSAAATMAAAEVQIVTAPRDAIVDEIHVAHGEQVEPGDLLVTLADPDLQAQIIALVGRRAVLAEQQARWTEALVETSASQLDRWEQAQSESRLVREELQSIDDQLAMLRRAAAALQIRAQQAGRVDAWQIESRLQSRPLRRGDAILQVIADSSSWNVLAQVSASRIALIRQAAEEGRLSATVVLEAHPTTPLHAELRRLGPAITGDHPAASATAVLLELDPEAAQFVAARQSSSDQNGSPARLMLHCGPTPAGYVLFQDLFRSARATAALYVGGSQQRQR